MCDSRLELTWQALRTVIDPEIGRDLVTLGLVYGVTIDGDVVHVTHTLTTPGCPLEHVIRRGIERAVGKVDGIGRVQTHVVWDPLWNPGMIEAHAWGP